MRSLAIALLLLVGCFEPDLEPTEPDAAPMADASPDAQPEPDATPDADTSPVTGTEIAIRLYGAMCEHSRVCAPHDPSDPSDDCTVEMATRFCEMRRCGEEEAIDRAVLIACADLATTWQCEDPTNNAPPCVLELLSLVAKDVPQ
jgi:hypothetical protein